MVGGHVFNDVGCCVGQMTISGSQTSYSEGYTQKVFLIVIIIQLMGVIIQFFDQNGHDYYDFNLQNKRGVSSYLTIGT